MHRFRSGDDGRDLEGPKKAQQHNAGHDPAEAGTSGLQQVSRAGSDASRDGALLSYIRVATTKSAPRQSKTGSDMPGM